MSLQHIYRPAYDLVRLCHISVVTRKHGSLTRVVSLESARLKYQLPSQVHLEVFHAYSLASPRLVQFSHFQDEWQMLVNPMICLRTRPLKCELVISYLVPIFCHEVVDHPDLCGF